MEADREKWDLKHGARQADGSPSPWILTHLDRIDGKGLCALDLACGLGRHAYALAERGWQVAAWDISPVALARIQHPSIHCKTIDLDEALLPQLGFDLIVSACYLDRRLWPQLSTALKPGGWLLFETFVDDGTRKHNPAYVLAPGELRTAFPDLLVQEYREYDGLAALAAQKPA